jgi:putative ABC transport system permease protein
MLKDVAYSLRMLRKSPVFTLIAALALAIGIGANTCIFSVVNAVLLQPLPFQHPGRIMTVWETSPRGLKTNVVNPVNFLEWQARNHSFTAMAAFVQSTVNLRGNGDPEQVPTLLATGDFFSILGVQPLRGRAFTTAENAPGGPDASLISYGLWQRQYGGDPAVIGRTVRLAASAATIVGVMPPASASRDRPPRHGRR